MVDKNITMVRGDTLSFGVELDGLNQDLSKAFFTCKADIVSSTTVFQKTLGNGITKVDTNKYRVRVAPEDTKTIEAGRYFYDLQIEANSDVFTIMKGILEIEQDVTF